MFYHCYFHFRSEYKKLLKLQREKLEKVITIVTKSVIRQKIVVIIAREYGSGGRYVGELLAKKLRVPFYDKNLVHLTSKESGLSDQYIKENEQMKKKY